MRIIENKDNVFKNIGQRIQLYNAGVYFFQSIVLSKDNYFCNFLLIIYKHER